MEWDKVPKVFQISVLNFIYNNKSEQNISVYRMRTDDNRCLSDRMTVIFLELPKIKSLPDDVKSLTATEKWGKFILYAGDSEKAEFVRLLCESEEGIMAARVTLAKISEDETNWLRQRAHDKWMRDYNTGIHVAEQNGFQQGMQQGIQQGMQKGSNDRAIETAKKMLSKNLSAEIIAECTSLSLSEINAVQSEMTIA